MTELSPEHVRELKDTILSLPEDERLDVLEHLMKDHGSTVEPQWVPVLRSALGRYPFERVQKDWPTLFKMALDERP